MTDIKTYITDSLSKVRHDITSDWLSYCLSREIKFEVLQDTLLTKNISLKLGVPAVGRFTLTDNDYLGLQDNTWKKRYSLLCNPNFTVCLEEIKDVDFLDKDNVTVTYRSLIVKFEDVS